MANGIGKIALGRKQAQSSWAKGTSRASQISYQMGNKKRQENAAYRNTILSSLGSLASGFKQNTEAWGKYEAGAEAAGIDVGEASFGDKLLRGFGLKNVDLAKQHDTSGAAGEGSWSYSGAELMNIGEKKQTGTLESFLGDKKIGDLYGGESKGYQAFSKFGKEGQDWQGYRDKEILGKGVGTDYDGGIGALGVSRGVGTGDGLLSEEDLMSTMQADTHKSVVEDIYGEPDKDRYVESSEQRAARERMYTQTGQKRQPNDPLSEERQRYQEGIVAREADEVMGGDPESWGGNFEQGSSIEDMWAKDEFTASPHTAPGGFAYDDPQPDAASDVPIYDIDSPEAMQEQLTRDAEGGYQMDANELASIRPEAQRMSDVAKADAAGMPIDPMASARKNLERNQLGVGADKRMTLNDIWNEQDRLSALLKPTDTEYNYGAGGLHVSVTGKRKK